jgi:hypothetical protein
MARIFSEGECSGIEPRLFSTIDAALPLRSKGCRRSNPYLSVGSKNREEGKQGVLFAFES